MESTEQREWRRTETGPPVLSWCLVVRNGEALLEQCLRSLRERSPQAEIVIVDTMSRDGTLDIARRYADVLVQWEGPQGRWTADDPWVDDMAAARQHAFMLASGRWRGWADHDDLLPGPEEVERMLRINGRWRPAPENTTVVGEDPEPVGLIDLLQSIERDYPSVDMLWAPYLYQRDENDQALVWQDRERIVKWPTDGSVAPWVWSEAAHEVLVPVKGHYPVRADLSHLLFVHEKDFSAEASMYAVSRHFAVLHAQYLAPGGRTTRRCLYLAAYAPVIAPEREREFIEAAHEVATTPLDRYRSLMHLGNYWSARGLFLDALESYSAAKALRPDLPDVFFAAAEAWWAAEDYTRCAEWCAEGLTREAGKTESFIVPRHHTVRYPTLRAEALIRVAKMRLRVHDIPGALADIKEAEILMMRVVESGETAADYDEAVARYKTVVNERRSQEQATSIATLGRYLLDNDESEKIEALVSTVPWNLQDHPYVVALEAIARKVHRHKTDDAAYDDFYNDPDQTGMVFSPDAWLEPDHALDRVKWIAAWINENCPRARVLDMGCFDGIVGIPLLKACPDITYVGVEPIDAAIDEFDVRLRAAGLDTRAAVYKGDTHTHSGLPWDLQYAHADSRFERVTDTRFDVVIWSEVIEHVPNPRDAICRMLWDLSVDGAAIFITTPWGAYDAGMPPEATSGGLPRGFLGHLRAMTPRDMAAVLDDSDIVVEDLNHAQTGRFGVGDEMHVRGSVSPTMWSRAPVSFVVPSALWDWNGRTLWATGMGASEKAIVQVAESLAHGWDGGQPMRACVYGPVPEATIYKRVGYWPHAQVRRADGPLVVSRSPGHAITLNQMHPDAAKRPKILWLQDAYYPDLSRKTADLYEAIVVVSEWHKQAMCERHGVPLDKMHVIYNPVDVSLYMGAHLTRRPNSFIYASSPDRGLIKLLELWPHILDALPDATLDIFYGWRGAQRLGFGGDAEWTQRYEGARKRFEALRHQSGVRVHGMVDPVTLAQFYQATAVWAYPTDFTETGCANAVEARAAGCIPVCPPLAALDETARCDQAFMTPFVGDIGFEDAFVGACVAAAQISEEDRADMAQAARIEYSVDRAAAAWRIILDDIEGG